MNAATTLRTRSDNRPPFSSVFVAAISWLLAGLASFVFLSSLPYKFSGHTDSAHIFSTIGAWIGRNAGDGIGGAFARHGAYVVGSVELLASLLLLAPAVLWTLGKTRNRRIGPSRARMHLAGGALAALLMTGATFFHLLSPLGTVVVNGGVSDGGALFRTALTVLAAGLVLSALNLRSALRS